MIFKKGDILRYIETDTYYLVVNVLDTHHYHLLCFNSDLIHELDEERTLLWLELASTAFKEE